MTEEKGLQAVAREAGEISAVAREQAEIQSMILAAKKFPRDDAAVHLKVVKAFSRPGLAEKAQYSFPRGKGENKTTVKGASIDCARELARCFGNVKHGTRIVSFEGDQVHIRGYCHDLENNSLQEVEGKFSKLVMRKNYKTGVIEWREADERELREVISKNGSIAERNAILGTIPRDLIDAAIDQAEATLRAQAAGKLKDNREDTVRKIVVAFDALSISKEMIEAKLGHALDLITGEELVELTQIYASIRDGNSKREEHFEVKAATNQTLNEVNQAVAGSDKGGRK